MKKPIIHEGIAETLHFSPLSEFEMLIAELKASHSVIENCRYKTDKEKKLMIESSGELILRILTIYRENPNHYGELLKKRFAELYDEKFLTHSKKIIRELDEIVNKRAMRDEDHY